MSVLGKFRHQDGFKQLVRILELSEPEKQKNLLDLIATEDPGWARLAQIKILTCEKILTWPETVLGKLLESIDPELVAAIYVFIPAEQQKIIKACIPQRIFREVKSYSEKKKFTQSDSFAAQIKLIQ